MAVLQAIPFYVFASTPNVQTYAVGRVWTACAILSGWTDNTENTTHRWFEWGPVNFPNAYRTRDITTRDSGNYRVKIAPLQPNTQYSYRSVAMNDSGISYGSFIPFTTVNGPVKNLALIGNTDDGTETCGVEQSGPGGPYVPPTPTPTPTPTPPPAPTPTQSVSTLNATHITDNTSTLNGVAFPGCSSGTYGWFQYGRTPNLGSETSHILLSGGASVLIPQNITGLLPGTAYFFRPVIQSSCGTSYGLVYSFRTTGVAPYVPPTTPVTPTRPTPHMTPKTSTNVGSGTTKKLEFSRESQMAAANLAAIETTDSCSSGWLSGINGWLILLAHIFFILGLFFLFLFFCCRRKKKEDEVPLFIAPVATSQSGGKIEQNPAVTPWLTRERIPVVPQKTAVTAYQKGVPPINLPV